MYYTAAVSKETRRSRDFVTVSTPPLAALLSISVLHLSLTPSLQHRSAGNEGGNAVCCDDKRVDVSSPQEPAVSTINAFTPRPPYLSVSYISGVSSQRSYK